MPNGGEATVLPVPPGKPRAFFCPPAAKPKVLPRPPAAAAVGSCFQQSIPGDPPRPCQKRCWGALGRGDRAQGGMARGSSGVRKRHPHQPACLSPLPAPPPHAAASGPHPGASASCRRSAAGLEESKGDGGMHSLGTAHPAASLPLTAHVLLASPVDRQHIQRVKDGAVGTHRAGVPMPRGKEKGAIRTAQAAGEGAALGGLAYLPLLSSSASSSGM